jgi:hypothetical protein
MRIYKVEENPGKFNNLNRIKNDEVFKRAREERLLLKIL